MALALHALADAPTLFLWTGLGAAALSVLLWLWFARRLLRALFRRAQAPIGLVRYGLALSLAVTSALGAVACAMLCVTLAGYRAFTARSRVAEVQCIELAPQKLRVYYVPISTDGTRGATSTFDVDGDEWTVGGEVLRFRPTLIALGVPALHAVTRVEGRWDKADDANGHKATAYDLGDAGDPTWAWLKRNGARGPLKWIVAGAHGQAVSQLPDRRALYDLFITPNGYVLDKRSL